MALSSNQVNRMLRGIYSGSLSTKNLPKSYYNDFVGRLNQDIKKGFGVKKVTDKTKYLDKMVDMSENATLFAGGKTYHLVREIAAAKRGTKSYEEFEEAARAIYDKYERWGVAESNTMVAQAQSAKKWQQIEEDREVLPKLRYSTIGDACVICAPLNGLCLPVGHPMWNTVAPINHYNCLCLLTQEPSSARVTSAQRADQLFNQIEAVMDDTFKNNVGVTGEAFPRHPYFEVLRRDEAAARRNFDLPVPDIRNQWINE